MEPTYLLLINLMISIVCSFTCFSYIGYKIYRNYKKTQYYNQIQNKLLNICKILSPYYMAVVFDTEPDLEFIRDNLHAQMTKENPDLANINHLCYIMTKTILKNKNKNNILHHVNPMIHHGQFNFQNILAEPVVMKPHPVNNNSSAQYYANNAHIKENMVNSDENEINNLESMVINNLESMEITL